MTKGKILLVDDDVNLQNLVRMAFEDRGYEIICSNDGKDGLAKAKSQNPDLIVLDLMLPYIHGYQICRFIKFDDQYKKIPVVLFSSRVTEGEEHLWKEVRADAFVSKIEEVDVLLKTVEDILEQKRLETEEEDEVQ